MPSILGGFEAVVLAHPPADGSKRWTITEVLKGDQPHHTLNLRSLPRLYRDTPPPPEGVVCLFDRQYHWFGPLTIRRTLDLHDGLIGSTGLTLEQFRHLVAEP